MSFIWQLRLSKTIVDSLTLKIPGRILRFGDNGRMKLYRYLPAKSEWSGKLAKFSAPYLNPTFFPPPPPSPTPPFSRGEAILMGFQPGESNCPSFIEMPLQFFSKESSLWGTGCWSAVNFFVTHIVSGESPYPGKTSRKIANLLQTGYRMPRPAHISQEL